MQAATQEALESGENPTHTRSFSLMRVYRRSSMCMLVTTSDSKPPSWVCKQGMGIFLRLEGA